MFWEFKNYKILFLRDYRKLKYLYSAGKISVILDYRAAVSRKPALSAASLYSCLESVVNKNSPNIFALWDKLNTS